MPRPTDSAHRRAAAATAPGAASSVPKRAHGKRCIAVVGAGWAGLAAAVEVTAGGHAVSVFEMAPQLGGRARQVDASGAGEHNALAAALDNGQHILIGAYVETLRLMARVGVDIERALLRQPLSLVDPQGYGLRLPAGPPMQAFVRGALWRRGWPLADRMALLCAAAGWWRRGFTCDEALTVAQLTARLPASVRHGLVEPLCVAALNTPADAASGRVFLRVLQDALLAGSGSADLLLPRVSLSELLPRPAGAWLERCGARLTLGHRVHSLQQQANGNGWRVDGEPFDAVVLAASATESARLAKPFAAEWAAQASALRHEPIVTVYLHSAGTRLPQPMLTLRARLADDTVTRTGDAKRLAGGLPDDEDWPAQFVFDLGQLGGPAGRLALVASGAQRWVDAGLQRTTIAALAQAEALLAPHLKSKPLLLRSLTEKRATFRCTPGLLRPRLHIANGLLAAGDYVSGPYPATLEGAVRSGLAAARAALAVEPPIRYPAQPDGVETGDG